MKYLVVIVVCAVVGALVSIGLNALLRDSTGFLAENRSALVGGVCGGVAVLILNVMRKNQKGRA